MIGIGALIGGLVADVVGQKIKDKLTGNKKPVANPGKSLLKSKTIWGGLLLALGPWVVSKTGINIGEWSEIVGYTQGIVGLILVYWGRKTAKTPIGDGRVGEEGK